MTETKPRKVYYSIGEVCELVGVKAHVLRYWETQFPEIRPMKNRQKHRIYKVQEIYLVIFVKRLLYTEKRTMDDVRGIIAGTRDPASASKVSAAVKSGLIEAIREDLAAALDQTHAR
ncbi:MAG: MerR family transcriptional regulator [Gemmatimonadetes bacterium]|nr:MerR family transcriptional regulator [Gemmatimonadota bacterium]